MRTVRSNSLSGFSLVEVMVALLVISVGMLGIAKMQALALSSTGSAKTRSLAALQAASLGATMQADRAYWSNETAAQLVITIPATGAFTAPADPTLAAPTNLCQATASPCTPAQLAAQDLNDWMGALRTALPTATAVITCVPGATSNSAACNIVITWTDTVVALNTATNTAASASANNTALQNFALNTSTYTLFVQP